LDNNLSPRIFNQTIKQSSNLPINHTNKKQYSSQNIGNDTAANRVCRVVGTMPSYWNLSLSKQSRVSYFLRSLCNSRRPKHFTQLTVRPLLLHRHVNIGEVLMTTQ